MQKNIVDEFVSTKYMLRTSMTGFVIGTPIMKSHNNDIYVSFDQLEHFAVDLNKYWQSSMMDIKVTNVKWIG